MRHKLLGPTTLLLWVLNAVFVCAAHWWPNLDNYDSAQRLLVGIMIVVTIAWLLHRAGIEFRIGYRQGRKDRDK